MVKDPRPSWDRIWYAMARTIALRSRCVRDQIGAVIVDSRNRIVATGYNGPPAGYPIDEVSCDEFCQRAIEGPTDETRQSYGDCVTLHSEANALLVCDRTARLGGTIYVSSAPCWNCAKLIANSGLARVVVPKRDEHFYRAAENSYAFLRRCGLEVSFVDG